MGGARCFVTIIDDFPKTNVGVHAEDEMRVFGEVQGIQGTCENAIRT